MKTILKEDSRNIWHPYTRLKGGMRPLQAVRAEGAYLYDISGTKYIDAVSSWWTNLHGHSHPYILNRMANQMKKLDHVLFAGVTHPAAVLLAKRLLAKMPPNQDKVFFSDDGSTAVEAALKMALQYWYNLGEPRHGIIAFKNGYHGDTFGAMSVSGRSIFSKPFRKELFHAAFIDVPVKGKEKNTTSQMRRLLSGGKIKYAAFIFEPLIQGAGGMVMYNPEPLNELMLLCRKHHVITIADEVMTGFGRTGKFFASDYLAEKPDIFCLSKGLTGGVLPMGMNTCSRDIFDAFYSELPEKTFYHGHSYTANPIACSAALASMDLMERKSTWKKINNIGRRHKQFVRQIIRCPLVADARSRGTVMAVEVKTQEKSHYLNSIKEKAVVFFLKKKILLRPLGNTIYVIPPYCITMRDLDYIYASIKEFLDYESHV